MAAAGVYLICGLLPFEEGYGAIDVFGLVFISLWTVLVSCGAVYAFSSFGTRLVIDGKGVSQTSFLPKRTLPWANVADWGLSYCGQTRGEGSTYYLYFSEKRQKNKNQSAKRLRGKMIKIVVIGGDYREIVTRVVPFCQTRTQIEPFIGGDAFPMP